MPAGPAPSTGGTAEDGSPPRSVVLFAGGGTAGHVFPAIAVAHALVALRPDIEPVFVGTAERLEGTLVPQAGFRLHHVGVLPLPRRLTFDLVRVPRALAASVRTCTEIIAAEGAVAAVTFGGYVSFPLARAARKARLPLVVHEQNSIPGLANRVAARWADRIAVSFPGSADRFPHPERTAVTGNPVRVDFLERTERQRRTSAYRRFGLERERTTLLVFGGSQGARSINRAVTGSRDLWARPTDLQILHAAGRTLVDDARAEWEAPGGASAPLVSVVDFIDDMARAFAVADVIVCRAGATTIAELTVLGKVSVLVPYPHAARDHQTRNANDLAAVGAARVIVDADLTPEALVAAAEPLLLDPALRAEIGGAARSFGRPDAARNVARLVADLLPPATDAGERT